MWQWQITRARKEYFLNSIRLDRKINGKLQYCYENSRSSTFSKSVGFAATVNDDTLTRLFSLASYPKCDVNKQLSISARN